MFFQKDLEIPGIVCTFAVVILLAKNRDMKLTEILSGQYNAAEWEQKGYELPKFNIKAVREKTAKEPTWVHFGGGNIFRAFPAAILNDALNTGKYDRGVIVAETFDFEVIDKAYAPYDNLSLCVNLCSDGSIEKKVIASVTEALKADPQFPDWNRLVVAADDFVHHYRERLYVQ